MAWTNLFTAPRNLSVLEGFPLVSPQSDLRLSAHTNGGPQQGRLIQGIKLSSAATAAHIHMNIKVNSRSDAGLCVGNCDAQGIT